jgi:hypothetical protein
VFRIKHLADVAGQRVFADIGTFMLERTIRSFIESNDPVICNEEFEGVPSISEGIAQGADRHHGLQS